MNDRTKKLSFSDKPLAEMTLDELEAERRYREGVRYAFDGDNPKMHKNLQRRVDEIHAYLTAAIKGETYDPEK